MSTLAIFPGSEPIRRMSGLEKIAIEDITQMLSDDPSRIWDSNRVHQVIREGVSPGRLFMLMQSLLLVQQQQKSHISVILPYSELLFLMEYFFIKAALSDSYVSENLSIIRAKVKKMIDTYHAGRDKKQVMLERNRNLAKYGLTPERGHLVEETVNTILNLDRDVYASMIQACRILDSKQSKELKSLEYLCPLILKIFQLPEELFDKIITQLLSARVSGANKLDKAIRLLRTKGSQSAIENGDIIGPLHATLNKV